MFKNFILVPLSLLSFAVFSESKSADSTNPIVEVPFQNKRKEVIYTLYKKSKAPLPTEHDIQEYQEEYGELPQQLVDFYSSYGNCIHLDIDILSIHGGQKSQLAQITKIIQQKHENYHAFAFDQPAGGWWVYYAREFSTLKLFSNSSNSLTGDTLSNINELLKK